MGILSATVASRANCNRVQSAVKALPSSARGWSYLRLPRWLVVFVATIALADAAAIAAAARLSVLTPASLLVFGLLVACSAVTVEITRRLGESALFFKDICGVWELPAAVLLPPLLALLAPLPRLALMQWRVRRIEPHRRVFTATAVSLSYGAVSVLFHLLTGSGRLSLHQSGLVAAAWILAVAGAGALNWVLHSALIMTAIKGTDPSASLRQMLLNRKNLYDDAVEICVATLVAAGVTVSPVTLVFALPFVTLLQRSMRHAQLVNDARMDAKTGVLNAASWRREASAELARVQRTGACMAVALIDIDHFKAVNDQHGHLAGDDALRAVCDAIGEVIREYDVLGRFGGEEFSLLMPQTDEVSAAAVAERVRAAVEALRIRPDVPGAAQPIGITVSIGVAESRHTATNITELLAAADASLYQAKNAGRNQVRACSDTAAEPCGAGHAHASGLAS